MDDDHGRAALAFKASVEKILNHTGNVYGRLFAYFIQFLIILSLITFSVSTVPGLSAVEDEILHWVEVVTIAVFTLEYILRIYVAKKKKAFIFSFYGMIDLIAILPFYISTGMDLRAVRVFRLFRLVRILKLIKYSKAIRRFHRAMVISREEIVLFIFVTGMMLFLSAVGIYYFEHEAQPERFSSVFHCLWWSVTTLTTVGYGDMYPVTVGGKVFTFFVLVTGLGIVAVPTGLIASALSQAREEEIEQRKKP